MNDNPCKNCGSYGGNVGCDVCGPPIRERKASGPLGAAACSESSSLDEVLAGNALFFLLDLRPLYDFVNNSDAPRNVKDCLRRINLAAASIEGALGADGYARAKARDEKMKEDLERFLSANA
jgi:hypothetical protein